MDCPVNIASSQLTFSSSDAWLTGAELWLHCDGDGRDIAPQYVEGTLTASGLRIVHHCMTAVDDNCMKGCAQALRFMMYQGPHRSLLSLQATSYAL